MVAVQFVAKVLGQADGLAAPTALSRRRPAVGGGTPRLGDHQKDTLAPEKHDLISELIALTVRSVINMEHFFDAFARDHLPQRWPSVRFFVVIEEATLRLSVIATIYRMIKKLLNLAEQMSKQDGEDAGGLSGTTTLRTLGQLKKNRLLVLTLHHR